MDYYGPEDYGALPAMLEYLYVRRESLLREGLSLAMEPQGRIRGIVSSPASAGIDYYQMRSGGAGDDLSTTVPRDGADGDGPGTFYSSSAHLPCGFRTARSTSPVHTAVPVFRPEPPPGGDSPGQPVGSFPRMEPTEFSFPRAGFDQDGPGMFVEAVVPQVLSHEDGVCFRELGRFGPYGKGYVRRDGHTLADLCEFVGGLNAGYPPFMRLDTAFVGRGLFSELADGPVGAPLQGTADTVDLDGVRLIGHGMVPDGEVYAMSHTHGPIFVNGPTTLTCTEDEFVVGRYCQAVSPHGGLSGRTPYGIKAGVTFA